VEVAELRDHPLPCFDKAVSNLWMPSQQDRLRRLDGYVFVVAEYNHSITGVLKNPLDQTNMEFGCASPSPRSPMAAPPKPRKPEAVAGRPYGLAWGIGLGRLAIGSGLVQPPEGPWPAPDPVKIADQARRQGAHHARHQPVPVERRRAGL
jgi:hypothetical protein